MATMEDAATTTRIRPTDGRTEVISGMSGYERKGRPETDGELRGHGRQLMVELGGVKRRERTDQFLHSLSVGQLYRRWRAT